MVCGDALEKQVKSCTCAERESVALTSGRAEVFAGGREAARAMNVHRRHAELIPAARPDIAQQRSLYSNLRGTGVRGHGQRGLNMSFESGLF